MDNYYAILLVNWADASFIMLTQVNEVFRYARTCTRVSFVIYVSLQPGGWVVRLVCNYHRSQLATATCIMFWMSFSDFKPILEHISLLTLLFPSKNTVASLGRILCPPNISRFCIPYHLCKFSAVAPIVPCKHSSGSAFVNLESICICLRSSTLDLLRYEQWCRMVSGSLMDPYIVNM